MRITIIYWPEKEGNYRGTHITDITDKFSDCSVYFSMIGSSKASSSFVTPEKLSSISYVNIPQPFLSDWL